MSHDPDLHACKRERPTPSAYKNYIKIREWLLLLLVVIALSVGIGLEIANYSVYENFKGIGCALAGSSIIAILIPSVIRCAGEGYNNVWLTSGAAIILLFIFLFTFYTSYFLIVGMSLPVGGSDSGTSRILTFPPMISAACIACLGWYIHFQASAKNHRTSNSFQLIMHTRTSKEFLDRATRVHSAYPYGTIVPSDHVASIAPSAKRSAESVVAKLDEKANPEAKENAERLLKIALDADAVKYLLNFYEFMAVGIKQKDLEEIIIYDTLGVAVTSIYERAQPFINYINGPNVGQTLAFCQLDKLVKRWNIWLEDERSDLNKRRAAAGVSK